MGSPILWPVSLAPPGPCNSKLPPLRTTQYPTDKPLRHAKLERHRHSQSLLDHALRPAQACMISAGTMPLMLAKLAIHRHAGSPLHQPTPFRHFRSMLQRLTNSPQLKASICRPMWPHPPATHHKSIPNLHKRHTQTPLGAKEVTLEKLRLQIYCSRTGDLFFSFFFPLL
jgi:hypothetical protein